MTLKLLRKGVVCLGFILGSGLTAFAQSSISGTVTSTDNNAPLTGVSVLVKGSATGATTDSNGNFTLQASPSDVLEFTYLGFKQQEQAVGTRTVIDVVMQPDSYSMDNVVVMGYSSIKKAELTSAVSTINSDKLTDVSTADVGNMLQSKMAGVLVTNPSGQPGTAANIRIRGIGSLGGQSGASSQPLYVVDGVPGGSYDANDVETITVLKDVGATAIYGASGANGVIVITTKKAAMNEPVKIEFKAHAGAKEALFGHFKPMNAREAYAYQQASSGSLFTQQKPEWLQNENFDWMDAGFNTGSVQDYYVAASGGGQKLNYRVSVDHYREKGTLINTGYHKTAARVNLNAELAKNLTMSVRLNYDESKSRSGSNYTTLEGIYRAMPWDNPYDQYGNPVLITTNVRPDRPAATEAYPVGNNTWWGDPINPMQDEEYNYAKSSNSDLMGDVVVNWDILSWLSVSSTNRFSRSYYNNSTFLDPRTKSGSSASNGSLTYGEGFGESFLTSELIKMGHQFGDHSLNGLLGWEWSEGKTNTLGALGNGMPAGMDSFTASAPTSITGGPTGDPTWGWSAFAQVQYNYKSKYFITGVFRADNSSVFGPGKRTGYFPAVSAAWLASNEEFLKDNKVLTSLKLRASYGQAGNSNIPAFQYLDAFKLSPKYMNTVGAIPDRLSNKDLHWEVATTFDAGLDFTLANAVDITVDYYNRRNSDLLMDRSMAPSSGFFSRIENVGEMRNTGWEVAINSTNIHTQNFVWTTSFNISFNKNKMTKLIPSVDNPDGTFIRRMGTSSPAQIIKNGYNVFTWYMPEWYGVDPANGDPLWYGADGNPTNDYTQAPDRMCGTAMPKFYGGLANSITWKYLTLDFNFAFNYGNKIFNNNRIYMDTDGLNTTYNQMSLDNGLGWSRWENPGDQATHPKLQMLGNHKSSSLSSRYLEDGSYLRLRNITLSFNLPEKWINKAHMSSARIYVSCDNLWTWSGYSGSDPEVDLEATSWSLPGISSMNYPVGRTYTMGIEFAF